MATPRRFLDQLAAIRREVKKLEAEYVASLSALDRARQERDAALALVLQLRNELDEAHARIARFQKWEQSG